MVKSDDENNDLEQNVSKSLISITGMILFFNEPNIEEKLGYLVNTDGLKMEFKNITIKLYPKGQKINWLGQIVSPDINNRIRAIPFLD